MPRPADSILVEAAEMGIRDGGWYVRPWQNYGVGGVPNAFRVLSGEPPQGGRATHTLSIPADGSYKIWVRYANFDAGSGAFTLELRLPNNQVVAHKTFAPSAARQFIWEALSADLDRDEYQLEIFRTAAGDPSGPWLDCILATEDGDYLPDIRDLRPPLYLQVTLGNTLGFNSKPVRMHLSGEIEAHRIDSQGMHKNAGAFDLGPGVMTPWVDISPLVYYQAEVWQRSDFRLLIEAELLDPATNLLLPPARSEYTVKLSRTDSTAGMFKEFHRADDGSNLWLTVDVRDLEETRSSIEWSQRYREYAARTPQPKGRRPTKFPLITFCMDDGAKSPNQVIGNNLKTLAALGLSGLEGTGLDANVHRRMGLPFTNAQAFIYHHAETSGQYQFWQANFPGIQTDIARELDRFKDRKDNELIFIRLMDEIFSADAATLLSAAAPFRDYLQRLGLTPGFFGKNSWSDVQPVVDKGALASTFDRRAYYHTMRFRSQLLVDFFARCSQIVTSLRPELRTAANASTELGSFHNLLVRGVDWFGLYRQNALGYGLFADANVLAFTQQVCGYTMDFARSACSRHRQPFGIYHYLTHSAANSAARAFTEVGHGARLIDFYTFGPNYVTPDGQSHFPELYPVLKEFNHAVGAVEDRLLHAEREKSKVALLYSHTSDIWDLVKGGSGFGVEQQVFGAELMYLHLLLTHLGYPVEIITEEDVLDGAAPAYRAVFVTGPNLRSGVLEKLLAWVRDAGGVLYVGPGAAERNEFNDAATTTPAWQDAGVHRMAMQAFVPGFGFSVYPDWLMSVHGTASDSAGKYRMGAVSGFQKLDPALPTGTPLLTLKLEDGTEHVCANQISHGTGSIFFVGFFLGIGYARGEFSDERSKTGPLSGHADLAHNYYPRVPGRGPDGDWELWRKLFTNTASGVAGWPSYSPRHYPDDHRRFIQDLLLPRVAWKPTVRVTGDSDTSYLIEANLLTGGEHRDVLVLANWSYDRQEVRVKVTNYKRLLFQPWAAINRLRDVQVTRNEISFSMILGSGDFIVLP